MSRIGNIAATWSLAEWRKGVREVARVPAHAQCRMAEPFKISNARMAARLRSTRRGGVGVWSLRQIAKQMGTTATRVRELLRARKAT